MSYQDKLKYKFPDQDQKKKERIECDPTSTMFMTKEQIYQFERIVSQEVWTLGQRCIEKVMND